MYNAVSAGRTFPIKSCGTRGEKEKKRKTVTGLKGLECADEVYCTGINGGKHVLRGEKK